MDKKPVVLFTRKIPQIATKLLALQCTIEQWNGELPLTRAQLLDKVARVDAILSCLTERIDQQVFSAAGPQLKVVANFAVGFDNIDLDAARAHGVTVTNAPAPEVAAAVADKILCKTYNLQLSAKKAPPNQQELTILSQANQLINSLNIPAEDYQILFWQNDLVAKMRTRYTNHDFEMERRWSSGSHLVVAVKLLEIANPGK